MSYYYYYYIGYIDKKDNKIYPYGPYTRKDKENIACVLDYSQSFDEEFSDHFITIPSEMYSDELRNTNHFAECLKENYCPEPKYCKVSELPTGGFVKTGYFLIRDVVEYMKDKDSDVFYDRLDPVTYNGMVASELQFGKPEKAIDDFGEEYVPNSAGDYMYFAYPDYSCAEYKAHQLRMILNGLMDFEDEYDGTKEFVILETEG